jgi:hypothetical protein
VRWGRLAGFLAIGLVLHLVLARTYVWLLQGHKAIRSDRQFQQYAPRRISVLVVGDSHPRTGIDATMLGERAFNIALGGEHYLKNYYRMRALVEGTHRSVASVVLPLDASSFSSWEAWNFAPEYVWGRYVDFVEVGRMRGDLWGYLTRELKARVFPYAGELRTLAQMRGNRFGFGDKLPDGKFSDLSVSDRRDAAIEQARLHFDGCDPVDPGLVWALRKIVDWTEQNHVKLALIGFPVVKDYWRQVEQRHVDERVQREVVEPLLRAHPDVVRLDYHDRLWGQPELFADPHHLNADGRAVFTAMLRDDLVKAWGIEVRPPAPAPSAGTPPPAP